MKGLKATWNLKGQVAVPGLVVSIAPGTIYQTVNQNGDLVWRARVQIFGSVAALDKARAKPEPTQGAGAMPAGNPAIDEVDISEVLDEPGVHPADTIYAALRAQLTDSQDLSDGPSTVAEGS